MNSAIERRRAGASWIAAAGLGLAALIFASGCADHGPTNLYSQPLFGQQQAGAHMEVVQVGRTNLNNNGITDLVGFNVYLKNTGSGGTAGPLHVSLAVVSGCATVNYATATFGNAGQVIQPGDIVQGVAVNSSGIVVNSSFAFTATYDVTSPCAGTQVNYTVTATDPYQNSWNSGFIDIAN